MFSPKLNTPRSRYQSLGASGGNIQSRKRSSIYTPQKKSFTTPSGKNLNLNSSLVQGSRVYEENGQHRLEGYGQALPILVTEALALKDKHTEPSVLIAASGWTWMVCNRRLLVWILRTASTGKATVCHELNLPPSSVSHKAGLVSVIPHAGDGTASCIALSPEGAIRYWANIAHEGSFVEMSTDLKGEECAAVTLTQTNHCIVSTTTSSLLLVSPPTGQCGLQCRVLRAPQGILKGFSRRMSSFIFGSTATQSMGESFHQISAGEMIEDNVSSFYVLCGSSLQKWIVSAEQQKMLYQCNVEQFVCECLSHEIWHQGASELPNLKTWLLDMAVTRDGVVILAAGMDPSVSNNVYYCIGVLHTAGLDSPQSFLSFSIVRFTSQYTAEDSEMLDYRLLLPNATNARVYLHHKRAIICTSITSSQQAVDKLEFYAAGDRILGAGCYDGAAIFFSSSRGFLAVKTIAPQNVMEESINETLNETASRLETSLAAVATTGDKLDELSTSEDKIGRLKAAFLHLCRGNTSEAQALVDELFPPGLPPTDEIGSNLDMLVTQLSSEMIDDSPALDPRWAETHNSVGSSVSLILVHQLEDKLKAHQYLVQFLKTIGLWDRLGVMQVRNTVMHTSLLLCEHAEKLVAARALRELHTQYQEVVDEAITIVLEMRGETIPSSGLTAADIFYRQVSHVHEFIDGLAILEERNISGELTPRELVTLVHTVNTIMAGMVVEAVEYRQSKSEMFQISSTAPHVDVDYLSWTSSEGPRGLQSLLIQQHAMTVDSALPAAQDSQERGALFQQLLQLTGTILDGYNTRLGTLRQNKKTPQLYTDLLRKYEEKRFKLIVPFVAHKQYERAVALAERYTDFMVLIRVCEETDNQDRLQRYMSQFHAQGFPEFVFKWYINEGKRGKLMTSSLSSHPQLRRFLQTGENRYMSWLHDINSNDLLNAHKTLFDLGVDEKISASKKKTLLSLSKLAALATEDPPEFVHNNLEAIGDEQDLLLHQEQIPIEVLERLGLHEDYMRVYTPKELIEVIIQRLGLHEDYMRVYTPKELIELHVGEHNTQSDEHHFKKALDLLYYIDKNDPDYSALLIEIWSRSILRDDWSSISSDDHLEGCRNTVFFKTVELAHSTAMELKELLPHVDVILSSDPLTHLNDNSNFQFIIKACFEQIHRVLKLS